MKYRNHFIICGIDVLVPTLVWQAGRTAEAMRTIAVSCLCSCLNPSVNVDLFANSETVRRFIDKLFPLLLSLTEDASYKSRKLAIEALKLLKNKACDKNCWTISDLNTIYPGM